MSENGTTNGHLTPIAPGGASSALDMAVERDRGAIREAIKRWPRRWQGVDDGLKREWTEGLRDANRVARAQLTDPDNSLEAAKVVASIVRTGVMIEGQNQSDDHKEADLDKPSASVTINANGPSAIVLEFDRAG